MCGSITESSMRNHSNSAVRDDSSGEARVLCIADLWQARSLYALVRRLWQVWMTDMTDMTSMKACYDGEKQVWRVQMVVWLVRSLHERIEQVRRMLKGVVCVGWVQMTLRCARWMYECVRWVRSRTRWWTISSTMLSHRRAVMTGTKCVQLVRSGARWWTVSSTMLSHRRAVMTGTKCVWLVQSGARWWTVSSTMLSHRQVVMTSTKCLEGVWWLLYISER